MFLVTREVLCSWSRVLQCETCVFMGVNLA